MYWARLAIFFLQEKEKDCYVAWKGGCVNNLKRSAGRSRNIKDYFRSKDCPTIETISILHKKHCSMKKTFLIILFSFMGYFCYSQTQNLALNETYTASVMDSLVNAGHNPRLAFDDNVSSAWHPQRYPTQWIAVHFENLSDIDSINFWYGQDPGGSTTQEIYSTEDGVNWALIEIINPYHFKGGGPYTHIFSDRIESSKGIKIRTTANPSWIQWREIMIWGNYTNTCYFTVYDTIAVYDTTFVTIIDTLTTEVFDTTYIAVHDTVTIEVFDTTYVTETEYISVTDTLIIDAVLTGIDPPKNLNTLKVYPNPAKDHIFINTGDYTRMNGYSLKIIDQLGAIVFETNVEEALYEVNLSNWMGMGLYILQVIDSGGKIIDARKIILQ